MGSRASDTHARPGEPRQNVPCPRQPQAQIRHLATGHASSGTHGSHYCHKEGWASTVVATCHSPTRTGMRGGSHSAYRDSCT